MSDSSEQNDKVYFGLEFSSCHHLYVKDFIKAGYLSIEMRYQYLSVNMMYNIFYDQDPSYLCQFKRVGSVHSYETRGSIMVYVIPEAKTQGKRTFMYNGAKLWNSLDISTRSIQCKYRFKKECKIIL